MRGSLNLRISLLIIATAVLVLCGLSLVGFLLRDEMHDQVWQRSMVRQVDHWSRLIAGSDNPPAAARDIASHFGVNIRIIGNDGSVFTTNKNMPAPATFDLLKPERPRFTRRFPPSLALYRHKGKNYLVHSTPHARFIYQRRDEHGGWLDSLIFIAVIFSFLIVLFGGVTCLIHRMLRPLRRVSAEMESYAQESVPRPDAKPSSRNVKDEVSLVAANFAQMRARVDSLLAAKETLLRDVSHEIRSPLTRMRLRLEFMEDKKLREQMVSDLCQIDNLAGELLDRAYLDSAGQLPKMEKIDLCAQVREAAAVFKDEQRHIQVKLPDQPVMVQGDVRLLQRCLINLINNSLKHSQLEPGSILVSVTATGSEATLSVSDRGPQISDDVVKRLFEPFYRPDSSRNRSSGGHGLGLAMVSSIAKAHQGQATAISPPEGGLVVNIVLPQA